MMKSSVTIAGILVSVLLGISHFETVNLSLWNRAEIHVLGDGAGEHLWSVVASSGTADGVLTGTFLPCLGAGKVEPTHRLTKELSHTLVEDVVDGYSQPPSHSCRCCSNATFLHGHGERSRVRGHCNRLAWKRP